MGKQNSKTVKYFQKEMLIRAIFGTQTFGIQTPSPAPPSLLVQPPPPPPPKGVSLPLRVWAAAKGIPRLGPSPPVPQPGVQKIAFQRLKKPFKRRSKEWESDELMSQTHDTLQAAQRELIAPIQVLPWRVTHGGWRAKPIRWPSPDGNHRQGCMRREGASEAAPGAVRQAVGGGCSSGWGRLLSVTNAVEAGSCRHEDSGWAQAGRSGGCVWGGASPPFPMHPWLPHGVNRTGKAPYPPPPCISYALVQATVGVGTVIILYAI